MKQLTDIQNIYFVGIGGIGMSALARYFNLQGKKVYGYDKTPSVITTALIEEGISVNFEDSETTIPELFQDRDNALIIFTPAIPKENKILSWFTSKKYLLLKRAEVLGEISKNTICLAVAGTHGKTTTSAILAHLLAESGMSFTAFLGGVLEGYNSNLIYKGDLITVVEADEFDRSFLYLEPSIACVTSMDADHLDIYENASALEETFQEFSKLVPNKKNLLFKKGLPLEGRTVSLVSEADFQAHNIRIEEGCYVFDLKIPEDELKNLKFNLPGRHNLFNAVTALGMAILAGTSTNKLYKALQSFKGVKRRFTKIIDSEELVLIDDYAHHPTEIDAVYQAVCEMYPKEKKLIVFQPHLFSRTRDFASDFARSLSKFDAVVLLDIYPAREKSIEGITSKWLLKKIKNDSKIVVSKDKVYNAILKSNCKIIIMAGAGDIGVEVGRIKKRLLNEN